MLGAGKQARRRRKLLHVDTDFRYKIRSGNPVHAGDGLPQADGLLKWAEVTFDLLLDFSNPCARSVLGLGEKVSRRLKADG